MCVFGNEEVPEGIQRHARHIRNLALGCILLFPTLIAIALYFFIKSANKRNEAVEKEKESKIELEQNYALMHDFYENTPIGFHSIDIEGNILDINNIELEWLGYKREEIVGVMNFREITVRSEESLEQLLGDLIRSGRLNNIEGTFIRKDGTLMPIMTNSRLIYDEDGQIKSIRVAVMNFSEKKKIEDELKRAKELAEHTSMQKDQFVANVSHEIRTPLNAILSFSKLLVQTPLNDRQKEYINNIHTGSENLLTIINDILDFSKIEAGVLRIERVPFNLKNTIATVEQMFRYKAEEKGLDFEITLSDQIPEIIVGDPNRLVQMLVNLLGNAFKFTEKGKIALGVSMLIQVEKNVRLLFKVEDTGAGIPVSKLKEIFKRFGQVSTDSTRKYGGAGLGLTITKQLADLQDGTVRVKSKEGEGSSFMIEIPYKIGSHGMELNHDADEGDYNFSEMDISILVAEDNPTNRRIFELQFNNWGLTADFANNGKVAVDMLREKKYDIVLMDIQMPEMDGYTASNIIREELDLSIPIIAITAHVFSGELEKCISYGMNDYLSKPIKERELFALLKQYLQDSIQSNDSPKKPSLGVEQDFDRKYIFALTRGDRGLLSELAVMTIKQSALELQEIKNSLKQKKYTDVAASAHSMRSTVLNMGFNKLMGQVLLDLEEEVGKTNPEEEILLNLFNELEELREQAVSFLTEEYLT